MIKYNPKKIEKRWQKRWEEKGVFEAKNSSKKPKFYALVEFPYPSGEGLHVGHCRSYVGMDVLSRKRRMQGFNVLFPMGWDAFGLPTENYAIKTGIHPAIATKKNTKTFKKQEKSLGLSFDWSREIDTTDPEYYKWTQWIFLRLFEQDLAYKEKMPINWCPSCKIGLANEEVIDGKCERCGSKVVQKEKEQWLLKITKYADRLLRDLELVDYPEKVKISQREWIGRSEGTEIEFGIKNMEYKISVFTTRPDTIFGATYLVVAPEHPIIEKLADKIVNFNQVKEYILKAKHKPDKDRLGKDQDKTGVEIKGVKAINPVNGREIPIFAADYVLMSYGKGAIMAVPGHDQRDFDFAKRYNLPILQVITPRIPVDRETDLRGLNAGVFGEKAYEGEGILINSERFNGMDSNTAKNRIAKWLEKQGLGKNTVYYKLRDWIFSRQRYWGEPIPLIFCEKCGWQAILVKDLPVELPKIKDFKPTEEGESPLMRAEKWINVKCPKCKGPARRETDVMPNWAGSNWYYLRYCDPKNKKELASQESLKYWMPVDWYNGGMEHTTLHLLYSRFIYKFLWDIGAVHKELGSEPYKKRTSHGLILAEGGVKMSKSKGNVVNPDKVVKEYGADCLRVYEMFMGPFEQAIPWDTKGLVGVKRFLKKVWKLQGRVNIECRMENGELERLVQKTIKKVGEDIDGLKFNTAVSALMILVNEMDRQREIPDSLFSRFLIILNPFAPHIAEELWEMLGQKGLCSSQEWPKYDDKLTLEKTITLIIQINGKVRAKIEAKSDISEKEAKELALSDERIKGWLKGKEIKKTIFIPGRLVNLVAVDKG